MAELYDDIPSIAVIYEGTVAKFEETLKNTTKAKEFYGRVVFITGNQSSAAVADKKQAIWVSEEDGTNAHYLNMSDAVTLSEQLSFISGLAIESVVSGNTVRTPYDLTGGKGFILAGDGGITVSIEPDQAQNIDDKLYWRIKVDASGIQNAVADIDTLSKANQQSILNIQGTAGEPFDVNKLTLHGLAAGVISKNISITATDSPATGISKRYTFTQSGQNLDTTIDIPDFLSNGDIFDESGDIKADRLPDFILGQLLFGGTMYKSSKADAKVYISPSTNFKDKYEELNNTILNDTIDVTNASTLAASDYEGAYFIVANPSASLSTFSWSGLDLTVGDWVVSKGDAWVKIDNTDAVASVAGLTGAIDAQALKNALAIGKTDLSADVQESLGKADSAVQLVTSVKIGANNIPSTDPYIDIATSGASVTITTNTATITDESINTTTDGLATVADIRAYLRKRLSIKVVSSN